ncbi:fibronectin type III domain protein [Teladorsagia circumcincta]|uniref:Fibronectin type III domain protein n=1 Tax=Teladorsagia circumcincta TaxID=45464 RepID=A0A2G9U4N4_TELCI|nr:fibronectin type III domain protein [Teladorsagia circumcincta]
MAFVPPDNLRRLIVQYYRQQGKLMPKNVTFSPKSFLFVKYHCDFGYEMVDEIDTLFCHQKTWVNTLPMCRGKVLRGPPKLYVEPPGPYEVPPGGNINITCSAVAYPFPDIFWQRGDEKIHHMPAKAGTVKNEQILIIKELFKNAEFTCHANNSEGKVDRTIKVVITGPGSAPVLRGALSGRTNIQVRWDPPHIINRPITSYTVYYTNNGNQPIKNWQRMEVKAARPLVFIEQGEELLVGPLKPFELGCNITRADPVPIVTWQHKLSALMTLWLTQRLSLDSRNVHHIRFEFVDVTARPPHVTVTPPGKIVKEPSNEPLSIECEALGVPKPRIIWLWSGQLVEDGKDEFRVYDITPMDAQDRSTSKLIAQSTTRTGVATCQAVNAEGSDETRTEVKILGPGSAPLHIQPTPMHTGFDVAWQPPRRPNGRIKNYIVYYTKDPDQPLSEWKSETVSGELRNLTVRVDDEDTPYVVKVQAATDDGPGIISEAYEVTTGRKQIPLTVRLEISDPPVSESDTETEVEPAQPIHFRCVAEGRPMPSVSYSWLPMNSTESGDEPVPIPIHPDSDQEHRYNSIQVYSTTSTKRTLLCQARNPDGTVEDKHFFIVNKPGSPPRDVNVIVDPDNRVTLTWEPPKHPNGDITVEKLY